jgi:hypothetical protein
VTLSIYLVGFTDAGIPGVVYATVLTEILRRPFALWYTAKIAKIDIWNYLKKGYGMPAIYLFIVTLPACLILRNYYACSWLQFAMAVCLFGGYALCLLAIIEFKFALNQFRIILRK